MPRPKRIVVAGLPHHLTQRGNNRMPVFKDEQDFMHCKHLIRGASAKHGCQIHSHVLMTNHFHLLATPAEVEGISKMMQSIELKYVRYFNEKYHRTGTMWEGRFGSSVIESGRYFFTVSRYIEMNPVRACMVADPMAYRWSSFLRNASGASDPLITPHELRQSLDGTESRRQHAYLSMFAGHIDEKDYQRIRWATRRRSVLGDEPFIDALSKRLGFSVLPDRHGGLRLPKARIAPMMIDQSQVLN